MKQAFRYCGIAVSLVVAAILTAGVHVQGASVSERFVAGAIDPNRGATGMVEMVVDRWSTDAERDRLIGIALTKGPEKLLDGLMDLPRVGYFRTPDKIGWDLHYARRMPAQDGGESIVLITDRRVGYWETVVQPPSIDYPFTVIELHLNADGKGEGRMSLATKIQVDKERQQITLENYEHQPVLLNDVHREKN